MSLSTLKVLRALLDGERYGLEIIDATGVKSGALYPILDRLEREGVVRGEWERIDEVAEGRRRRRYYQLTPVGKLEATRACHEVSAFLRPPAAPYPHWSPT